MLADRQYYYAVNSSYALPASGRPSDLKFVF